MNAEAPPAARPRRRAWLPRRWWQRLLLGAVVLVLAGVAFLWIRALVYASRADEAEARLRRTGAPVSGADAAPPRVPPARNAAVPLLEAIERLEAAGVVSRFAPFDDDAFVRDPWAASDEDVAAAAAWVARHEIAAATLLAEALARPRCRFASAWRPIHDDSDVAHARVRDMVRWIELRAALAARDGAFAAAYAEIGRMLDLTDLAFGAPRLLDGSSAGTST